MTKEEQRRQADLAARTMFNVFPQGTGSAIRETLSPAVQGISNAFTNLTSGPLIRRGGPQPAERPTPTTTVLPSGTPMVGFDSYSTRPSGPPSAPTTFPYGSALGPSIYTQTPTQTNLQTGMTGVPSPSSLTNINPPAFPVQQESISRMGLMGGTLSGGQVGPLPMEQITPMTAGQRPIIESGPVAMGIAGTRTPEQRGLTPIQTIRGTLYATPEQAQNRMTARTPEQQSSRSPALQAQLVAQMRERGTALAQQRVQSQEAFFTQKRAEREGLRVAENAARASGVRPMDISRARSAAGGPSTIAGIQQEFSSYQPQVGPMAPTNTLVSNAVSRFTGGLPSGGSRPLPSGPMGPSGYALAEQQRMARGSSNPYSNTRAQQRQSTRQMARAQGLQPAYSRQVQEEQEDYFQNRGLF